MGNLLIRLIDLFDLLSGMILQVLAWSGSTFFCKLKNQPPIWDDWDDLYKTYLQQPISVRSVGMVRAVVDGWAPVSRWKLGPEWFGHKAGQTAPSQDGSLEIDAVMERCNRWEVIMGYQ